MWTVVSQQVEWVLLDIFSRPKTCQCLTSRQYCFDSRSVVLTISLTIRICIVRCIVACNCFYYSFTCRCAAHLNCCIIVRVVSSRRVRRKLKTCHGDAHICPYMGVSVTSHRFWSEVDAPKGDQMDYCTNHTLVWCTLYL